MEFLKNFRDKHSQELEFATITKENGTFDSLRDFCSPKKHHSSIVKTREDFLLKECFEKLLAHHKDDTPSHQDNSYFKAQYRETTTAKDMLSHSFFYFYFFYKLENTCIIITEIVISNNSIL